MSDVKLPDVWLRGPVAGVHPQLMPAAHAFLQAAEDVRREGANVPAEVLWLRPGGAASLGFHLKHLVGSTGRLLGYARGEPLSDEQKAQMAREGEAAPGDTVEALVESAATALERAVDVLRGTEVDGLLTPREVGKARLPTTSLGAIFHAAEHAQRHAGQFVTTVKVVRGGDPPKP